MNGYIQYIFIDSNVKFTQAVMYTLKMVKKLRFRQEKAYAKHWHPKKKWNNSSLIIFILFIKAETTETALEIVT